MLGALHAARNRSRERLAPLSTRQLLAGFVLALTAAGRAGGTLDWYQHRVGRMVRDLGDGPADAITTEQLRHWLIALKAGRTGRPTSDVYVEGHRKAAASLFTWAVRERHLKRSPMANVDRYRVTRPEIRTLTRDDVALLLSQQPSSPEGLRNRAVLALMYDTAIRVGELVRLRLEDVDLETGEARVIGKNRRVETVPLSPKLRAILWTYIHRARPRELFAGTGHLFVSRGGDALTTNAVRLWMRRAKEHAGLAGKRVSPHVIRATAATHFAANGATAFEVQRFLRHRTRAMSERYVDLAQIDLSRQHAIASPLQRLATSA